MNNKTIAAIVLTVMLLYHKQLNIKLEYLLIPAFVLTILSVRSEVEQFNITEPFENGNYTINDNVNSPSNVVVYDSHTHGHTHIPSHDTHTHGVPAHSIAGHTHLGHHHGHVTTHTVDHSGNIWTTSNLGVDGDHRVKGSMSVDMDANVKGSFDVQGPATFHNDIIGLSDTHLKGKLDVGNAAFFNNDLNVHGTGRFSKDVDVNGPAAFNDTLTVGGDGIFKNNLTVRGNHVVDGEMGVNGMATFANSAEVSKNLTVGGNLSVKGSVGQGFNKCTTVPMSDNGWGDLVEKRCPDNHFMCGLKIRHEYYNDKVKQDNTGINGISLKCCPFE